MGMSASQARYLGLIARQNDLEYQGQQINQERTVLSQQVTDLYNTLQTLTVPTPPSTSDFTTIQYAGTIGATSYSFDASSIKPGKNGSYIVTVTQDAYGDSIQKNAAVATVDNTSSGTLQVETVATTVDKETTVGTGTFTAADNSTTWMVPTTLTDDDSPSNFYVYDGGSYRKGTTEDKNNNAEFFKMTNSGSKPSDNAIGVKENTETVNPGEAKRVTSAELSTLYVLDKGALRKANVSDVDGTSEPYTLKADQTYYKESSIGTQSYPVQGAVDGVAVNNHPVFEIDKADITDEQKAAYKAAIEQSGLTDNQGNPYKASDFYLYFDDKGNANFALKSDVNDGNNNALTYAYVSNGKYSKPTTYNDCQLTFDPTSGRITNLALPVYDTNDDGTYNYEKVKSYTSMDVKAHTVTDEIGYQDAYNKYEYAKYEYDKTQQEINAKTEIIQQEDKKLELKLQRLDNERTQITTEIEAVKKVIGDNIEGSYKTFSG